MDEKSVEIPARLKLNEGATARRQIVSLAGDLVQKHPDKFRVVAFNPEAQNPSLRVETVLVFKEGEVTLRLSMEKESGAIEQRLTVVLGSGSKRKTVYRLDVTRQLGNQEAIYKGMKEGSAGGGKDAGLCRAMLEDWLEEEGGGNPAILTDRYAESIVEAEEVTKMLESFREIKLPRIPLGFLIAPTLQELKEALRKKGNDQSAAGKLIS